MTVGKLQGRTAQAAFVEAQERLLAHYGVEATSRFVTVSDPPMRVHLLEAGGGDEPVVMLHGGDGQGADWVPLIGALRQDAHIFAVDRPAFGLTDRFDYRKVDLRSHAAGFVRSLLDALGLESATLVAGSMGGFFALAAALDHPERVRRLAFIGMPLGVSTEAPLPLRIMCGVPGLARKWMRSSSTPEGMRKAFRTLFQIDPDTVPQPYMDLKLAGRRIPGVQETWAVMLRRVAGLRGMRPEVHLGSELPRLAQPTLVVWGERDMASVATGREATARMPRGTFTELAGVGHFPYLEAPEQTARLVRELLAAQP
ncbi:MAG: alpha/beta hydrolase [Acidimicrobiia bacterium]|nr:alpha/beta hydrolase [Acidimicrobiia bacterium]